MRSKHYPFVLLSILICFDLLNSQITNTSTTTTTTVTTVDIKNPHEPKDRIVNPHNFSFIINPGHSVCNNSRSPVYILIYVHSSPKNSQRRMVIRETWATQTLFPDFRVVFMIGKALEESVMKAIYYENEIYQDIVQEDFIDAYKNLTYKGIMALKWISIYCLEAKYILKADDDIVVNTFTLMKHFKFLDKLSPNRQRTFYCLYWDGMRVMRDRRSKWYLSKEDFPFEKFPPYCSGSAFIFTNDMTAEMYNASLYMSFFWVDDYYITGAVAKAVNATYSPLSSLYTIPQQIARDRFFSSKALYNIMFGHFPGSMNSMREVWQRILLWQKLKFPEGTQYYSFSWDESVHKNEKPFK